MKKPESKIVRVPNKEYERLRKEAFKLRRPMGDVIADALKLYFEQKKTA